MIQSIQTPAPGIHPDTPMGVYHQWDAASNSRLSRLMRSAAHLKAYIETPPKDTPALRVGRAIHMAVLEPDEFELAYRVATQCEATVGSGKNRGKRCTNDGLLLHGSIGWVCGVHGKDEDSLEPVDREILSASDHERCLAVRDSVHGCDTARELITGPGDVELSMLWTDDETDVLCKARWDRYTPDVGGGAIVDLKSTTDAHPLAFEKAVFNFGYHRQACHYLMGAKARKLPIRSFVIIAAEKEPPYAVGVYRITDTVVQGGEEQIRVLLRRYAECMESGHFPGYPDRVRELSIPVWAWSRMDEQTNEILEGAEAA